MRIPPAVALLFIAPAVGELASGHLAPAEFFNPVVFAVLALPYGCGALLCAEFARRWRTGWPGLLLLAVAYGVYEEGIVSRALFDPAWHETPQLTGADHAFGINWGYGAMLIHFHVTVSIVTSVLIAEMLYPDRRHTRWLGNGQAAACGAALVAWAPALALVARNEDPLHVPPAGLWIGAAALIVACVVAARFVRVAPPDLGARHTPAPGLFFAVGAVSTSVFVGSVLVVPDYTSPIHPAVLVPGLAVFAAVTLWLIVRWSGGGTAWGDRHRLALAAGWLAPFLILGILGDVEHFEGRSLVAAAAVVAVHHVSRRRRLNAELQHPV
jgi:hypothetical protein